jgi:hypothetical protein
MNRLSSQPRARGRVGVFGSSALFVVVFVSGVVAAGSAAAGPKTELCAYTTARGAIPDSFPLDACFDGTTLVIDNRSVYPLYVSVDGASGSSSRTGLDAVPPLSSRAFMETHSHEPGLLMPGYRMSIPVGAGVFKAQLEGTNHNRSYPLVRWLTEWFPGVSSADSLIGSANELIQVYDQHVGCLDRNGWLGDIGCEALYMRNIAFAFGRLAVNFSKDAIGGLMTLFSTVEWVSGAATQGIDLTQGVTRIEFVAATPEQPAPRQPAPRQLAPQQPAPRQPAPLPSLVFSVTGSCTSDGGVLGSTSANFTQGGRYTIGAWYPDGSPYTALSLGSSGTVRADGTIAWQWDCTGDPAGTYTTELIDQSSGRSTGHVAFSIGSGAPPVVVPPPAQTYRAQQASRGANTFRDPQGATGPGARIEPNTWVEVSCKIKPATTIASAYPDGYWYRIASAPWNNQFYAVANTFWNGDNASTPRDQWHNTDTSIPDC